MQPGQLSGDGAWYWDGSVWQPAVSADGRWRWNGVAWARVDPLYIAAWWHVVVASIFCWILGIVLVWFTRWPVAVKIATSVAIFLAAGVIQYAVFSALGLKTS